MRKTSPPNPVRIALYGMDNRSCKNIEMYLKGPCQGLAVVVGEAEAEIDMIDADYAKAKEILESRKAITPKRPIILISLQGLQIEGTFFIKKPINVTQMVEVIERIKALSAQRSAASGVIQVSDSLTRMPVDTAKDTPAKTPTKVAIDVYAKKSAGVKHIDDQERRKTAKHQSAIQLNEGGFTAFLGTLIDVDFEDKTQLLSASFDKRQFFLGYTLSAYKTAQQQSRVLKLNSFWKPLYIFDENREIWLDADDKQLRTFAGIKLTKDLAGSMTLSAVDTATEKAERALDKFQDMDAFIWKLSIWTSKGRFPVEVDIQNPVYLKRWPNFTRLVITPDALRIAALLVQTPKRPMEIAGVLNIKPQYVFVFISACFMLGWLEQCELRSETAGEEVEAVLKKSPKKGLLNKILSKLLGAE